MTASSNFSLGAGIRENDLVIENLSVIDILLASGVGFNIDRIRLGDQMAILSEDALRLELARLMQRLNQHRKKSSCCPIGGSRRGGIDICRK